jgi:hypothetical protein
MKKCVSLGRYLLISIVSFIITISVIFGVWASNQKKDVHYWGVVVDSETGQPVPNAKVVLTTWYYGFWDSNPTHVGTVTDQSGRFAIGSSPGYWIDQVNLSAASPDSRFCQLFNPNGESEVRIEVSDSAPGMEGLGGYTYEDFNGGWGGEVYWLLSKDK